MAPDMLGPSEASDYASASPGSSGEEDSLSSGCASPAHSWSSVDSDDLRELLEELEIVPPRSGAAKRRFALDGDDDEVSSPRQAPSRAPAAAAAAAAAGAAAPPRNRLLPGLAAAPAAKAATAAAEPEVIDVLDSSDEEAEEDWRIAAPATAQKRRIVDSDDEEGEGPAPGQQAALPPFFAAIPSLAAAAVPQPPPKAAPPLQPRPQSAASAAPPPRQSSQQHAAPAAAPPQLLGAGAAAAAGERPRSASAFKKQRDELARQLFLEFNRTVFGGRLPRDLEIKWNARLLTTAGLTHYRRDIPDDPYAPPIYTARVELSSKVLDCFEKLERTLCHELCHVAAWLLDHTAKPPHGPVFRAWADKAMALYTQLDITTCHAYEIFYAFRWQCSNAACLQTYGRHSNSIDVTKKVCGACRSPLTFLGKFRPDGTPAKQRTASKFARFVQQNAAEVRAALPAGTPNKQVMQEMARRFAAAHKRASPGSGGGGVAGGSSSSGASTLVRSLDLPA